METRKKNILGLYNSLYKTTETQSVLMLSRNCK